MMQNPPTKHINPPKLLRGLFSTILVITCLILLAGWAIFNYQVEQLVATRTSEYAHSIAQLAASSSTEPLITDNQSQLKALVENVARDPYIRSATIFAENGQLLVKYPPDNNELSFILPADNDTSQSVSSSSRDTELEQENNERELLQSNPVNEANATQISAKIQSYLQTQNDMPFIEKIAHQGMTVGWFKIALNRELLESSFRTSLAQSQNLLLVIASLLLLLLLFISFRYDKKINNLIKLCHRLLQINATSLPRNQQEWMDSFKELSETQIQALTDRHSLPKKAPQWTASRRVEQGIFCYCEFSMQNQDHENTAASLSIAELYLKAAVQSHGVQSQGEVLSGCLVPFLNNRNEQEAVIEALNLVYLIQQLLANISIEIKVRAFVGKGNLLILEDERAIITGVSLSNRILNKINQLSATIDFGQIIGLGLEAKHLADFGIFDTAEFELNTEPTTYYQLKEIHETVKQHTARQIRYIIDNYSAS